MTEPTSPAPGWYPDPDDGRAGGLRWWTGVSWTDDTVAHPWSSPDTAVVPPPAVPVVTSAPPAVNVPAAFASAVQVPSPPAPPGAVPAGHHGRRMLPHGRPLLVVALVVLVAVGVGVAALLVSASGRHQLDMAAVEGDIAAHLTRDTGVSTEVHCPGSVAIEAGSAFVCSATSPDGSTATIVVHQDDDQGNLTFGVQR